MPTVTVYLERRCSSVLGKGEVDCHLRVREPIVTGYATVGFTPSSTGTIEIEAVSGDLTPVTFTITTGEPPRRNRYGLWEQPEWETGGKTRQPLRR